MNNNKKYAVGKVDNNILILEFNTNYNEYQCISKYCQGNKTIMSKNGIIYNLLSNVEFFDTLDECLNRKKIHKSVQRGIEEDRKLTGYYNKEY